MTKDYTHYLTKNEEKNVSTFHEVHDATVQQIVDIKTHVDLMECQQSYLKNLD